MRVLYFTERDGPHDQRFLTALAGTEHHVYALRQKQCKPEPIAGITEMRWPGGHPDWSNWCGWEAGKEKFLKVLDDVQPDLVHAGPVQGPALLAALAEFHPLVTMSWGSDLLLRANRSPWMGKATLFTLDRTDIFLGDCQTVLDEAASYGFSPAKMAKFPWGVDLDHFSPLRAESAGLAFRRLLGWEDLFVLMCNRTWSPVYGVDLLAEAFAAVVKENENLRLLLVGDGHQSDLIHQILRPARDYVHFPGWLSQQEILKAYGAADLFINPSHCDGSSVSLLEALACGLPVLTSDIPSNREWVTTGEVGALSRDGDVRVLTKKILEMTQAPNLKSMGEKSRELAEARADWRKNFQVLLRAYQRACNIDPSKVKS